MVVLMTLGGAVAPGGYIKGAKGRQNFVVRVFPQFVGLREYIEGASTWPNMFANGLCTFQSLPSAD